MQKQGDQLVTGLILIISAVLGLFSLNIPIAHSYEYPLQVSKTKRYLVDQNNKPFFWSGDAAWSLIAQLNKKDVLFYLKDRREKGFNVIMVNLIEREYCTNPPNNIYGEPPFKDKVFTTPNERYFRHADFVVEEASKLGIVVLLCPVYLGYQCGQDGWCSAVKDATYEEMRTWGRYLGNRYKEYDNIVWCIGGDADPSQVKEKIIQCVYGILENDSRHLITSHNQPGSYAITPWQNELWHSINSVYSYSLSLYKECKTAHHRKPKMPFFLLESAYENEHNSTPQRLRSQAYWAVLSGGFGHIFGNCPIWNFGATPKWCGNADWKSQLDSPGSISMLVLQKLFRSRDWHMLEPDFGHKVLVGGYGFWDKLFTKENYAAAAITDNGNTMIGYLPTNRKIRVNMKKISGKRSNCWWYRPSDGEAIEIGNFPNSGIRKFEPPSTGDWLIVIDDASLNLPAPG